MLPQKPRDSGDPLHLCGEDSLLGDQSAGTVRVISKEDFPNLRTDFLFQPHDLSAHETLASSSSLGLSFLTCQIGIIVYTSQNWWIDPMRLYRCVLQRTHCKSTPSL